MSRIFVCGDLHGSIDSYKLDNKRFPEQKHLTKNDVLINLGDFGFIWYEDKTSKGYKSDLHYLRQLSNRKYTFAFLDGNHDNHNILKTLPETYKFGNVVSIIDDRFDKGIEIYYLKRSRVYEINSRKIFVLGGACSSDILNRKENVNYWKDESLTEEDKILAIQELSQHNFEVDYVLSHNCPKIVGDSIIQDSNMYSSNNIDSTIIKANDKHALFFNELLEMGLKTKEWHFGHWHLDFNITINDIKYFCHYRKIKELI